MFRTSWACRTCLYRLPRQVVWRQLRFQSTTSAGNISPALIARARSMTSEHSQLSKQLADAFESKTAKKIGELTPVVSALKDWDKANESLRELKTLIDDPSTDKELRDLATEDIEQSKGQLSRASQILASSLIPKHPFADLPCFLEVRPGIGGGEAAIFAGDLVKMFQAYCSKNGLNVAILKLETADGTSNLSLSGAGLTEAILEIDSPGAYGIFSCEAGVHRVQRVPATETKGRTHTSAASVIVLPSFPANGSEELDFNDPNSDFFVDPKDVRVDVMRASGAGGQHVNKTESAVRLTHIPTNTVAASQEQRSQARNKEQAWTMLRARIAQARREAREEEMVRLRRSVVGVAKTGRQDKIRTYNWNQQRVTDHRSGLSVHDLDDVIEGGDTLEKVMASVRAWMVDQEILGLVAEVESQK
ncbi:release factor [Aulographum hederae CBS 113979]|uniref:Release factor n=1 Tax=Aulographum hederae CBS 113979 TaxID=1176131 RepID=A0A6G1GZ20_9PEZI|nr:release factor [Aulographum hederae CBS 113979]